MSRDAVAELYAYLTPEEQAELDQHLGILSPVSTATGEPVPDGWRARLKTMYPQHVTKPFAQRHVDFWEHIESIEPDSSPDPFVAIWARGGAKSTNAEMAAADLGCRGKRFYCVYVRMTQDMADKSVANIASMLESEGTAKHYPQHHERGVGLFGNSKGWRRNRLWTAGGYVVDALGLDVASRGLKAEAQRPDLFIFDDIDDKRDGPHITQKKLDIITTSILPAGAPNCAAIFIQNLIIADGVASRLADGRADFLVKRILSGPFPAVEGLTYEWKVDPKSKIRHAVITGGYATWEGQPLEACQRMIDSFGLSAFLKECQHKVKERAEGVALRFSPTVHLDDMSVEDARKLIANALRSKRISVFGGIDFGSWRFAFTLWVVTQQGVVIRIDEYFAQRLKDEEYLWERAKGIHDLCAFYGIPVEEKGIYIWGDQANPTDIMEINLAFRNGWEEVQDDRGRKVKVQVKSKLRVVPVESENKIRKTSVDRLNNLLDTNRLRFRRDVSYEWRYDMNAGSEGTPQVSSRLQWEIENWSYPLPRPGEEQNQDPDDSTADGADCISSMRYGVMSVWAPTILPLQLTHYPDDKAPPIDFKKGKMGTVPHAADYLKPNRSRTPAVRMPRPRGR